MGIKFRDLILLAMILAFVVIVLGAYTRLSDAGLGCPDWPGCYGVLLGVPDTEADIAQANTEFTRVVEVGKAWKEMIHRYFAGTLGLLVLVIAFALIKKDQTGKRHVFFGVFLVALLLFQALLGMWTVTWQLKPIVVMGHLLGGFAVFNLLGWQWLRTLSLPTLKNYQLPNGMFGLSVFVIVVLVCQIALGGWVSSNYAALACTDFPTCQQQWWPDMNFRDAFVLWRGLGVDYEFGVLDHPARVAIHITHRIGAVVTACVILFYALQLWRRSVGNSTLRNISMFVLFMLATQVILGVLNVVLHLPLVNAVLHNAVALILLFSLVASAYMVGYTRK